MAEENVEIYRQRYETYRHLDKIRWQMLQLLVAIASATSLVLRSTSGAIEWWLFSLIGFALIVIANVMFRVGAGIRINSISLQKAALMIGDDGIPNVQNKWKSVAHWLSVLILVAGICSFFWPAAKHLYQLWCSR